MPAEARADELDAFGWWFGSGQFDPRWALSELVAVLRLKPDIHAFRGIAERLRDYGERFTRECIECLALMVEDARQAWRLAVTEKSREATEYLLRLGLSSHDAKVQELA